LVLSNHPLVQFKRGDHICIFYRDDAKLVETLAAYLASGLSRNERCFCAQSPSIVSKLRKRLGHIGVDLHRATLEGALEVHTVNDVYFPTGHFDPKGMMQMLERSIDDALARGFSGFRTAGEMCWALDQGEDRPQANCDQLLEYEAMVQAAYPSKPAIGLCQYPAHKFAPNVVDSILQAHRMALEETMVSSNHSSLTVRSGNYVADIVADRINPSAAFHYVVQQRGTPDVLSWGIEPTIELALSSSETILASFDS
jgi:hypothetical protein